MKAIISTTYSDTYLYFLPITTWLWNRLGVDVICFMPSGDSKIERSGGFIQGVFPDGNKRMYLINETIKKNNGNLSIHFFKSPEHKKATYAQCSRLYGACLDLPEDEILMTSDCDMGVFQIPEKNIDVNEEGFSVFGSDLVPKGQYPICYISAKVNEWRTVFGIENKTYQECLDDLLGSIECDNMRGNYWAKDQEEAYDKIANTKGWVHFINRSNGQNQFATKRYDRDDAFIDQRLSPDMIDYHFHRPGYEDRNFETILTILKYHYPLDDFTWLETYNQQYKKLL